MTGRYLLAIDAGTGSCRAVLFTEAGQQVAAGQREWVHREPPGVPGGQDFDVTAGWRAVGECIRDALHQAGADGADVAAVAATSMREGMVLFDRAGREIWACPNVDSPASAEAEDLVNTGAAAKIYAEAGDWVSITAPARLRWLARHEPGILAAAGRLGMLSDWIVYRLCGQHVTEPSCGSSSGMFALAARRWSPSITALAGLPAEVLPPVVDPGTVVGEVSAAAAAATGLRAGTAVVAGGADTQLGLLGAGAADHEYTVVGGTFWQNTVLLGEPLIDPEARLRTLCHVSPGEWMLEGIGFYCGMSMRWFRDAFCAQDVALARSRGADPYELMEQAAATAPAGRVIAIMSNVMNARRWVHASPSFLQFDLNDPAASGRGACMLGSTLVQLSNTMSSAGGYYTFVSRAIHPRVGFLTAWMYVFYNPVCAGPIYAYFGFLLEQELKTQYGINAPYLWWLTLIVGAPFVAWPGLARPGAVGPRAGDPGPAGDAWSTPPICPAC